MKRFTLYFLLTSMVLLSSCGKEKTKIGPVGYNFGSYISETYIESEDKIITDTYISEFKKIPGVTVTEDYVYFEDIMYQESDSKIREACSCAELALEGQEFEGYYDFVIHAIYITNVESFFYEKEYGTEPQK